MSHIEELKGESLEIHNKIIKILESTGVQAIPQEIINNCLDAIKSLYKSDDHTKANSLLSILTCYRESILFDDLLFSVVKLTMKDFPSLTQSIVKSAIKNTENGDFSKLLAFLTKHSDIKGVRYILKKHGDMLSFLPKCTTTECSGGKDGSLFELFGNSGKRCLNSQILSFLKKSKNVTNEQLVQIIENITKNDEKNMEILKYLYKFHKDNRISHGLAKMHGRDSFFQSIICPRLVELTEDEILIRSHPEKNLEEFVSSFSDFLLPSFISLIQSLNSIYLNEGKMQNLLRSIVKYIKIEEFIEIFKPLDASKHFPLFKDVTNVDLSVFMGLYGNSSENLKYLSHVLVGFSTFCSDFNHTIDKYIEVLKEVLNINFRVGCSAIEKLVSSHLCNLRENCVLLNPIPREESLRILNAVKSSKIYENVINLFLKCGDSNASESIKLLIEVCDLNFANKLYGYVMGTENDNNMTLYNALKLMVFFVSKLPYSFEFVHRLIDICMTGNPNEQKLAYGLLNTIKAGNKQFCICDLLFNQEILSAKSATCKNRLLLLYTILRNRCYNCNADNMVARFLNELVKFTVVNNVKSRKLAREIITELQENNELRRFIVERTRFYNDDHDLARGCVTAGGIIIECIAVQQRYIADKILEDNDSKFINEFGSSICEIAFSYELIVKNLLSVFSIIYSMDCCRSLHSHISEIMKTYIKNYNKKFNNKIKECVLIAKKNKILLNKEMKLLLKYKNKGGNIKNIQVIKNK